MKPLVLNPQQNTIRVGFLMRFLNLLDVRIEKDIVFPLCYSSSNLACEGL